MGIFTGNRAADIKTQLKPYGMVYELIKNFNVPVYWVISPSKAKDGTDFTYDGVDYKGGTFVISAGYITTPVRSRILYWSALGVVGNYTTTPLTLETSYKFTSVPVWTLDQQNYNLILPFFSNAGIPSNAYNMIEPENLSVCNDIFVMPHADPNWSSHAELLPWNLNSKGAIWAGCHAVSALETIFNPDDPTQQQNYLTQKTSNWTGGGHFANNSLIRWANHKEGTPPYTTTNPTQYTFPINYGPKLVSPSDPVAQFMGVSDLAHKNGSEQIYLPVKNGGWLPTTQIITYDPTQENIPLKSNGPAAVIAYGRGFGMEERGWVMYEAGHNLNKGTPGDVPAQRAFFNWSLLAGHDKSPSISGVAGITSDSRFKSQPYPQNYALSASYYSPISAGIASVTWTCTRSDNGGIYGSFSPNGSVAALNTTFTPSITYNDEVECILTVKIVDVCGRVCFESYPISVIPVPRSPIAKSDLGFISSTCAIQGYSATVYPLTNDSDPDGDPITITSVNGVNPADGTWSTNGNKVTFLPAHNFFGPTTATYTICDNTAPGPPYYGPLCATSSIVVGVGTADADGCYPGSAYGLESNSRITLTSLMGQFGTGALITGTALDAFEDAYHTVDIDYLNLAKDMNNYLILSTGKILRAKDKINISWSKGGNGTGTISVQLGQSASGPWTNSQTFSITPNGTGSSVSKQSVFTIPAGVSGINHIRISAGTYNSSSSAVDVWLDGVDYDYYNCIPAIPEAMTDKVDINEDIPKVINVIANDINPGNLPLTLTVTTPPQHGNISINTDNTITYMTFTDYPSGGNASDTFTYLICNTQGLCSSGNVELTIKDDGCAGSGQYIPPGTVTVVATFQEGTANSVEDTYLDQDHKISTYGNASTFKIGKKPYKSLRPIMRFNGLTTIPWSADVQSAILSIYETQTSNSNVNFSYSLHQLNEPWTEANATWNNKNATTAWATAGGTYISPEFNTTVLSTNKNEWKNFNITNMVQQWVKTPAHGGQENNGFLIKQTNENTSDYNMVFASSESGTPAIRPKLVVTYIIPPWLCEAIPNRPPLANPDYISTPSNAAINIPVLDNDAEPDGNTKSINSIIGSISGGTAVISGNNILFTPNGVFTGLISFMYSVKDNNGLLDTAYVYVTVTNVPPTANNDVLDINSNSGSSVVTVQSNDANLDGPSPLSTTIVENPKHGTATVSGININYTPNNNYTGYDTLVYSVCEPLDPNECTGLLICDEAFIYITVRNQPPLAVNDDYTIPPCDPFVMNILGNDTDPEENFIVIQTLGALSNPSAGTLTDNGDGTVTFDPATGFIGDVTFTYSLIDDGTPNTVSSTPATVTIHVVIATNNPPVATDDFWSQEFNESDYISVLDNDFDPDNNALTNPQITVAPLHGIASVMPNGIIEYIPNVNYYGLDSLYYSVHDIITLDYMTCASNTGLSDVAKVVLFVYKPNVNPTLNVANPPVGRAICKEYGVSATIVPGSGGGVGATDLYEYSINDGMSWSVYSSGAVINTTNAVGNVLIRTSRSGGLYGVPTGPITIASWPVALPPTNPSLGEAVPANGGSICLGFTASAIIIPGSGGSWGAVDKYEYTTDNGQTWSFYSSGAPISAQGSVIKIRVSRSGGAYGCSSLAPVTIASWNVYPSPEPPTATPVHPTCIEPMGKIILNNMPNGAWTLNPQGINGISTTTTVENLIPGTYTFSVKVDSSGCVSAPTTIVVNEKPEPPAPVLVFGGKTQCGGTVFLTATEGTGGTIYFQGTNSEGTSTDIPSTFQEVLTTGNYYFRSQSPEGCWGDAGMAEVVIVNANSPYTPTELSSIVSTLPSGGFVNTGTNPEWNNQNWCTLNSVGQVVSLSLTPNDTTDVLIFRGECITPIVNITNPGVCRNLTLGEGTAVNLYAGTDLNIVGDFINKGVFTVEDTSTTGKGSEIITIKGDWNNEAGEFYCGKGSVIFNGADTQNIDSRYWPFYDLVIDNDMSKAGGARTVLTEETTVKKTLSLKNGVLDLNSNTLILENKLPTAINRTSGYIYAEHDPENLYNVVRWNVENSLDTYTLPFGKSDAEYLPLELEIKRNDMSTTGYIDFSTYGTTNDNFPMPAVVNHLGLDNSGGDLIVDRYWYLGTADQDQSVHAKIDGILTFTYLDTELDNIIEWDMIAQRYNPQPDSTTGVWADMIYSQNPFSNMTNHGFCVNTPIASGGNTGKFKTSYVDSAQFFSIWVLSSQSAPLPVKLLNFNAKCEDGKVNINWTTATETNNHFFTVEKSLDGKVWIPVANVDGANNSSTEKYYSITDTDPLGSLSYYRLRQTDNNGVSELFNSVVVSCGIERGDQNVSIFPNPSSDLINIYLFNLKDKNTSVYLYDALGQLVEKRNITDIDTDQYMLTMNLSKYTDGIYFISIVADDFSHFEKVIKKK